MAGTNPGGEGKGFKLVTILITSVVAPVMVYFITHAIDTKTSAVPTQPIPAAAALQPTLAPSQPAAAQPTAAPTVSESSILPETTPAVEPTEAESASQEQETNPNGEGLQASGLALTIEKQDVRLEGSTLALAIHLRNTGADTQEFSYNAGAIRLKDSAGRVLEPLYGDKRGACKKQDLEVKKKIRIEPGQEIILRSAETGKAEQWCADDGETLIPLYLVAGKARLEAVTVEMDGLGPFRKVEVEVRLD
jgi:hypothetical protein